MRPYILLFTAKSLAAEHKVTPRRVQDAAFFAGPAAWRAFLFAGGLVVADTKQKAQIAYWRGVWRGVWRIFAPQRPPMLDAGLF